MQPTQNISTEAQRFNWLLSRFATDTPGILEAIAVSSDGLLIAMSATLNRADADRLAALASAINSLAISASRVYDLGLANKVIIDLDRGYLLVSSISVGSSLAVLARKEANLGGLAYEMAMFANRAGAVLTPQLIEELKLSVGA
ncbi:MAG: roadblock/LC7 domain-containing protein [Micromonosporaceae bacterium]|nr:roadblock/LC7 domain-containing protein [Micromonosporaceae bacterium]MBT8227602.1 roadblock/LC7 domain-containing protein [Dactylosporangium sp.]NNJ62221.1 dynein regulation protein LC7 [Dactylosporangium sp.]